MSELSDIMSEFMSVYTWDNHFGIGHFRNGQKSCVYQNLPEKATVNGVKRTISDTTISDAYTLKYSFLLSPS